MIRALEKKENHISRLFKFNSQYHNQSLHLLRFFKKDKINFTESGKFWVDEPFDAQLTKRYTFQTPTHNGEPARITIAAASNNTQVSSFTITVNGAHLLPCL